MNPSKFQRQTPHNQRCSDNTNLRAARAFFEQPLSLYNRQCFEREYDRWTQPARRPRRASKS